MGFVMHALTQVEYELFVLAGCKLCTAALLGQISHWYISPHMHNTSVLSCTFWLQYAACSQKSKTKLSLLNSDAGFARNAHPQQFLCYCRCDDWLLVTST
jgi:hypothetical protein